MFLGGGCYLSTITSSNTDLYKIVVELTTLYESIIDVLFIVLFAIPYPLSYGCSL
jgi:hypothetical protein